jgi:hypothetical protein
MMRCVGDRNHDRLSSKGNDVGKSVFSKNAYPIMVHASTPGGLIDKKQQIDPMSTTFGHPFDGGNYQTTATQQKDPPRTSFDTINALNPLKTVPEIQPHERGSFFKKRTSVPVVKTQFGANKSGAKSDTSFHKTKKVFIQPPPIRTARATEKVINKAGPRIPSFASTANLWGKENSSFTKGAVNPISNTVGSGRWQTVKRSAV